MVRLSLTTLSLVLCFIPSLSTKLPRAPFCSISRLALAVSVRGGGDKTLGEDGSDKQQQKQDMDAATTEARNILAESLAEFMTEKHTNDTNDSSNSEGANDTYLLGDDASVALGFEGSEGIPAVVETTTVVHHNVDVPSGELVDDDDDDDSSVEPLSKDEVETIIAEAGNLRATGKNFHDQKEFEKAAEQFSAAAELLSNVLDMEDYEDSEEESSLVDEYATCRLHESLCLLKDEKYQEAVSACSDVLNLESEMPHSAGATPALRARAYYRRSKAQLELGDSFSALQDARSAAFLGDSKAVKLYGKLMRGSSSSQSLMSDSTDFPNSVGTSLFESMLEKSSTPDTSEAANPMGGMESMLASSLLNNMMGQPGSIGEESGGGLGGGPGGLAKSVLSNLSKKLDKRETQEQIAGYLQGTSGTQLRQLASMAGFQLDEAQSNKIASFCNKISPKVLRRLVRTTKIVVYMARVLRKVFQVISKYRTVLVLFLIGTWTKSAVLRPLPVSKKAAKLATK